METRKIYDVSDKCFKIDDAFVELIARGWVRERGRMYVRYHRYHT